MRNQLLRDTDWASMAHGLEVRVPLVDAVLLRKIAPTVLAMTPQQAASPKAGLALSPSKPLPAGVVSRPKTGFTTPIAGWLPKSSAAAPRHNVPLTAHWSRQWAQQIAIA
jgi:asparagine synthase (glutamine-hydrolysing)